MVLEAMPPACCAAPPEHGAVLLGPGDVSCGIELDAAHEVPWGGIEDVLEGGDFGLREDRGEVVGDVEGVGAVEETEGVPKGGRVADVCCGGGVGDEAEGLGGIEIGIVGDGIVEEAPGCGGWVAGFTGVVPGGLVGVFVEAGCAVLFYAVARIHVFGAGGEGVSRIAIGEGSWHGFVECDSNVAGEIVML